MQKSIITIAYLLLTSLVLPQAAVGNVLHDESVDGDLPVDEGSVELWPSLYEFDLELGTNLVRGSGAHWVISPTDFGDGFKFNILPNKKVTVSISEQFHGLAPTENAALVWELHKLVDDEYSYPTERLAYHISTTDPEFGVPNTDTPTKFTGVELNSGQYLIYFNFRFIEVDDPDNFDFATVFMDYEVNVALASSISVRSVPIPPIATTLIGFFVLCFGKRSYCDRREKDVLS